MQRRIALYGGSFDPIHHGHLIAARSAAEALSFEQVIFLPSANPPHKPLAELLPAHHRAEMVRLAIAGESMFEFSDHDLNKDGPTYTVDTVRELGVEFGDDVQLSWIIGADSFAELVTWHQVAKLVDLCDIITVARPGWDRVDDSGLRAKLTGKQVSRLTRNIVETPRIDISSTDVRERVQAGASIRYLVPESVGSYIEENGLYR